MAFIISAILLGLLTSFLFLFSLVSVAEREHKAAIRSFGLSVASLAILLIVIFLSFAYREVLLWSLNTLIILGCAVFIIPVKGKRYKHGAEPSSKFDERNIMFSRYEIKEGDRNFEEYYRLNPEHKSHDDKFREKPGLLKPGSAKYDPVMYSSSNASFETVDQLAAIVEGKVNKAKVELNKWEISNYIKEWTKHLGAIDVGVTELKEYHKYSVAGRGARYGQAVNLTHKYAVAFTVEMDYNMVKAGPEAPIVMESAKQYLVAGAIATQLAVFIRNLGYSARAHIDANYLVICPLVAKDAGLGEIGRMGLLMTNKLGPRVRIGVVTTDLPLMTSDKTEDNTVLDFCTICKKCAEVCPSRSIPLDDRKEINGTLRWQINQEDCFTYWCTVGTDCGRCVSVCPYSHPDNYVHNVVRWGIKNSYLFRRVAAIMDDFFYGKKPAPMALPKWMKVKIGPERNSKIE